jgi:endonuclease YncB( thermonuclease family)
MHRFPRMLACLSMNNEEKDDIMNATAENTPWLSLKGDKVRCKVIDVYDADTITIIFPFCGRLFKEKCRLYGIDSAEIRTRNLAEKEHALRGKEWLQSRINNRIVFIQCYEWDKYGRLLGDVYDTEDATISINSMLVENKLAYAYDGNTKKTFAEWSQ